MSKQKGFSAVAVIAILAFIVLVGVIVWRVYDSNQSSNQTGQNQAPTQEAEEQADSQQEQQDPNTGYVVINEWGVRLKPGNSLEGLMYFRPKDFTSDTITFTTASLAEKSPSCNPSSGNIALGTLTRSTTEDPTLGGSVAKIGDYHYLYHGPQAMCSEDTSEGIIVTQLAQALETLEATPSSD